VKPDAATSKQDKKKPEIFISVCIRVKVSQA